VHKEYPMHCGCFGAAKEDDDAHEAMLAKHSSGMRPRVVKDVTHLQCEDVAPGVAEEYVGSWVAEVAVGHPCGGEIRYGSEEYGRERSGVWERSMFLLLLTTAAPTAAPTAARTAPYRRFLKNVEMTKAIQKCEVEVKKYAKVLHPLRIHCTALFTKHTHHLIHEGLVPRPQESQAIVLPHEKTARNCFEKAAPHPEEVH
jgi:hypothetical protein